jgi:HEPN domain-containing protein
LKETTKSWIEFAKKDLIAAEELLNNAEVANIVLFHSRQLVEKSIKAILEEFNIPIRKTHSINILLKLIPEILRNKLSFNEEIVIMIDEIYFNERYPSEFGILPSGFPSQQKAKEIFDVAVKMHQKCLSVI